MIGFFFCIPECSSGGRCLSVEYTDRVGEVAKKHGLKLHIDGARIFNASVVSKFSVLLMICSKSIELSYRRDKYEPAYICVNFK